MKESTQYSQRGVKICTALSANLPIIVDEFHSVPQRSSKNTNNGPLGTINILTKIKCQSTLQFLRSFLFERKGIDRQIKLKMQFSVTCSKHGKRCCYHKCFRCRIRDQQGKSSSKRFRFIFVPYTGFHLWYINLSPIPLDKYLGSPDTCNKTV